METLPSTSHKSINSFTPHCDTFIGAVSRTQARGGILVTTSDFTEEGRQHERESKKIVLVNGKELARLMIKYGLGIKKKTREVPEIDEDYFQVR